MPLANSISEYVDPKQQNLFNAYRTYLETGEETWLGECMRTMSSGMTVHDVQQSFYTNPMYVRGLRINMLPLIEAVGEVKVLDELEATLKLFKKEVDKYQWWRSNG